MPHQLVLSGSADLNSQIKQVVSRKANRVLILHCWKAGLPSFCCAHLLHAFQNCLALLRASCLPQSPSDDLHVALAASYQHSAAVGVPQE